LGACSLVYIMLTYTKTASNKYIISIDILSYTAYMVQNVNGMLDLKCSGQGAT
jgi:hypothetical protein